MNDSNTILQEGKWRVQKYGHYYVVELRLNPECWYNIAHPHYADIHYTQPGAGGRHEWCNAHYPPSLAAIEPKGFSTQLCKCPEPPKHLVQLADLLTAV